jgi:hypothetical protein
VLAISRALFDLSESRKVYLSSGVEVFRYQIEHEDEILQPGDAFRWCRNPELNNSRPCPGRGDSGVA